MHAQAHTRSSPPPLSFVVVVVNGRRQNQHSFRDFFVHFADSPLANRTSSDPRTQSACSPQRAPSVDRTSTHADCRVLSKIGRQNALLQTMLYTVSENNNNNNKLLCP
jgi:hypothetical protein